MMASHGFIYADTSVFGGVFDEAFRTQSQQFIGQVRTGQLHLVTSILVQQELEDAPHDVQELFQELIPSADIVDVSEDAVLLQQAYLKAGIVTTKWAVDALHVSIAVVTNCFAIVSWNFKHIVHFQKMPMYNQVNTAMGYRPIGIYTPPEVTLYDTES